MLGAGCAPLAGNRWGAIHIPRVGNEVVVEFLEGDLDRPTGHGQCLQRGQHAALCAAGAQDPKWDPRPAAARRALKPNFNEIRFEDNKGHEELHVQAERNMSTLVKHDQSLTVQADRKVTVHGNESISVTKNEAQTYSADRKMTVEGTNTDAIFGATTGRTTGAEQLKSRTATPW